MPGLPRYAASVDANQKAIVRALRHAGALVEVIKVPVDLLVGYGGQTYLMEVKAPNGRVAEHQERFIAEWSKTGGVAGVVRTATEALVMIGAVEGSVELGKRMPVSEQRWPWIPGGPQEGAD